MVVDPASAYIIAQVVIGGLKLAANSTGLKRIFRRIVSWLQERLLRMRIKLREYLAIINANPNREITKLADRIRVDSKTRQLAEKYAKKVCARQGVTNFANLPRASGRNRIPASGYDTGDDGGDDDDYGGSDADSDWGYSDGDYGPDNYEDSDSDDSTDDYSDSSSYSDSDDYSD
ncbi:hypothetical protein TWF694_009068 [Orbilia ellipsospora]|uniref:Uncharacterized protein n=1 Tax=Orbilia ellipsospora TaxID=2528407 RepID=A0AAV9XEC3_9PEZI